MGRRKPIVEVKREYTDEFKADLERRYEHYINGGEMVSAEDADRQINDLIEKIKKKQTISGLKSRKHIRQ